MNEVHLSTTGAPATEAAAPKPRAYYEVWRHLIRDKRLTHTAFKLFHEIHDRCDSSLQTFTGVRTFAKDAGIHPDSIAPAVALLKETGWLSYTPDPTPNGASREIQLLDGQHNILRKRSPEAEADRSEKRERTAQKTRNGRNRSHFPARKGEKRERTAQKSGSLSEEASLSKLPEHTLNSSSLSGVACAPAASASANAGGQPGAAPKTCKRKGMPE